MTSVTFTAYSVPKNRGRFEKSRPLLLGHSHTGVGVTPSDETERWATAALSLAKYRAQVSPMQTLMPPFHNGGIASASSRDATRLLADPLELISERADHTSRRHAG